jgi:hypothetical protein
MQVKGLECVTFIAYHHPPQNFFSLNHICRRYKRGSFPLWIRKEGVDDPKNEKGVGSSITIDTKQTKIMLN